MASDLDSEALKEKIKGCEKFIDSLKVDLAAVQDVLTNKADKYKEWEEVKQVAKTMLEFKEKDRDMHVRVGLGCDIQAVGEVTDYGSIFVDIGLGHLLEMECEEADKYSDIRMKALKRQIDHARQKAVVIKVHVKMMLLGISELQSKQ